MICDRGSRDQLRWLKKHKFSTNTKRGIFLGIDLNSNSFIILDKNDHSVRLIREAVFLEKDHPGHLYKNLDNTYNYSTFNHLSLNNNNSSNNQTTTPDNDINLDIPDENTIYYSNSNTHDTFNNNKVNK